MTEEALRLARRIVETLEEKKGEDILLLDLEGLCSFTDYFVICTGSSERTLKALAEEVQKRVKREFSKHSLGVEGEPSSGWILMDYGDVILHLFSPKQRAYYQLEELWGEGQVLVHMR